MSPFCHDDITYELFDITPKEFYADKFNHGPAMENALADPFYKYDIGFHKFNLLIENLQKLLPNGGEVLDIGCGSGPYAPTLLANIPGLSLYGVDMSSNCLDQALKNGYHECRVFNLEEGIPYPEHRFDCVISMDFFGHVEFRHKDAIIREINRVTRQGGCGLHGAETGFIDYFNSDPGDPNDPIRKYVHVDGHIGVEPAACLSKRFASSFSRVETNATYLHPFYDIDNLKHIYGNIFDEEFASVLRKFTHPEATQIAKVILGRFNRHFIDLYQDVFGSSFQLDDDPHQPGPRYPYQKLFRGVGLCSYTLWK